MLSAESYYTAWLIYLVGALGMLLVVRSWFRRVLSPAAMVAVLLILAALMLTPATSEPAGATYAPAIVVGAFELLTSGADVAMRALRPLAFSCGGALLMALVFYLYQRFASPAGSNS